MREAPRPSRDLSVIAATPRGEVALRLKVRWSLGVGPNHLVGCQFVDVNDFHTLRKLPVALENGYDEFSRATRPRGGNQ